MTSNQIVWVTSVALPYLGGRAAAARAVNHIGVQVTPAEGCGPDSPAAAPWPARGLCLLNHGSLAVAH